MRAGSLSEPRREPANGSQADIRLDELVWSKTVTSSAPLRVLRPDPSRSPATFLALDTHLQQAYRPLPHHRLSICVHSAAVKSGALKRSLPARGRPLAPLPLPDALSQLGVVPGADVDARTSERRLLPATRDGACRILFRGMESTLRRGREICEFWAWLRGCSGGSPREFPLI